VQLFRNLSPELVLIRPEAADRRALFELFGAAFEEASLVRDGDEVVRRLLEREAILSTGIGRGVAVPHAQIPGLGKLAMAASTHPDGVDYPSLDEQPVRLVFCLIGDSSTAADHLAGLARLARIARRDTALDDLIEASSGEEFVIALSRLEGA
jgi:mannitol/fructose-specific phosphotransferase system IIA component (Ntr-type)